jgi:acyl-CoA synthetase (AMP-forming)/AMP-acid ligase II
MIQRFLSLVLSAPGAAALIDAESGTVTTRQALLERANALAAQLTAAGLHEGDAIAVRLPNSVEFVAAFLAALQLRLVVIPIDRDATEAEVATILGHFSARAFVHREGVSIRAIGERPNVPHGTRLLKLTSGSTGTPKGVAASEANLIADCENICATMGITATDKNLGAIPFSHSYGFSNLVTPLLLQGTPVVFTNDYLPQSLIDLANAYRCTIAPLIPMVFEHLVVAGHGDFESVHTFISAGAPLPPRTSRRFRERFGLDIHSFYGCSETGGITYDRRGAAVERGTVGTPLQGVELRVDNGRLTVRGPAVAGGTFVTDDLVAWRDDELAITGRTSELINTAGRKVNPREVESVLLQIDGVREAKVYGEPAGARGDVVAAAIVATPNVTREQVREFCQSRLSLHKVPRIVKLIDEMPVDERGKIKRAALATL